VKKAVVKRDSRSRKAAAKKEVRRWIIGMIILAFALLYFFPILYMILSGFKTEAEAAVPAIFFHPTLVTWQKVLSDISMINYLKNTVFHVLLGTGICLVLGIPATYALVFARFKKEGRGESLYNWFVTTILLPPVAVLIPLYITFKELNLNHMRGGLLFLYVGFHLPLCIWLLYSFFKDVPEEVVEAARIDGCTNRQLIMGIIIPLTKTGIMTAGLLVAVFIWNEFFLGYNLTTNATATLPVYMARFGQQQGQFIAQLSASASISCIPPMIFGWISQKSLIKGLTAGAVKG